MLAIHSRENFQLIFVCFTAFLFMYLSMTYSVLLIHDLDKH